MEETVIPLFPSQDSTVSRLSLLSSRFSLFTLGNKCTHYFMQSQILLFNSFNH